MPVKTSESFLSLCLYALSPMIALFVFHTFILDVLFLYNVITWFDDVMHFLGGFVTAWTALIFVMYFAKKRKIQLSPVILKMFFLVGCVAIVGIFWEVYEFFLDSFFPHPYYLNQPSMGDTMSDFILDLLGGTVFSYLALRKK